MEASRPQARHSLALLAAPSHHTDFAIGCYCEQEAHCHRAVLRQWLVALGASLA
ncbi:DUF488 family protein, N3 subclade [Aeromonas crassostreae]